MHLTLVVEDDLSELVAKRLIGRYLPMAEIIEAYVAGGSIKSRIPGLNQRARFLGPVLALADLDRPLICPATLVGELVGELTLAPNMLIRIAVLEIESWILSDREGMARWLGVSTGVISHEPESLDDPKRSLVQLAARSGNRRLREAIAPARVTGTHRTGPNYNEAVGEFVSRLWSPEAARRNAPSLDRAITRIAETGRGVVAL